MAVSIEPWPGQHDDLGPGALLADGLAGPRGRPCRAAAGRAARPRGSQLRRAPDGLVARARRRRRRSPGARARRPAPGGRSRRRRRGGASAAGFTGPPRTRRALAAAGSTHLERRSPPRRALDLDVAAPAPDEVQGQEEAEPRPPCRRLKNGSKIRFWMLRRDAAPVVRDADADGIVPGRPQDDPAALPAGLDGVQRQVEQHVLQLRLVDADAERPGDRVHLRPHTEWARAVGSMSRATAARVGPRSTRSPGEPWPRESRRKCWVMPRQRRSCSRATVGALLDAAATPAAPAPSRACAARRIPSTQARTVASGVFSSCEKPEASMPEGGEAVGLGEPGLGRAPLRDVAPDLHDLDDARRTGRRIGEACTSSQTVSPSAGLGARRCGPGARPTWRQARVGQSPVPHMPVAGVAAGAAEHLVAAPCPAAQEGVVGGDDASAPRRGRRSRRRCC